MCYMPAEVSCETENQPHLHPEKAERHGQRQWVRHRTGTLVKWGLTCVVVGSHLLGGPDHLQQQQQHSSIVAAAGDKHINRQQISRSYFGSALLYSIPLRCTNVDILHEKR